MQQILKSLFQTDSLEQVSRQRLEELVAQYPSFGIGHYLLSQKLKAEQAPDFVSETQRTNLYFTNPLWLQWSLQNASLSAPSRSTGSWTSSRTTVGGFGPIQTEPETKPEDTETPIASAEAPDTAGPVEIATEQLTVQTADQIEVQPGVQTGSQPEQGSLHPGSLEQEELPAHGGATLFALEEATAYASGEERAADSAQTADTALALDSQVNVIEVHEDEVHVAEPADNLTAAGEPVAVDEAEQTPNDTNDTNDTAAIATRGSGDIAPVTASASEEAAQAGEVSDSTTTENIEQQADQTEGAALEEQAVAFEKQEPVTEEQDLPVQDHQLHEQRQELAPADEQAQSTPDLHEEQAQSTTDLHEEQAQSTTDLHEEQAQSTPDRHEEQPAPAPIPAAPLVPATAPAPQPNWEPAFEPYHTIDYFASQGIKLILEEQPTDKLGKQLKSFTEWLRVMRRLPQQDKEAAPDLAVDRTIQTIAAHSIEDREILTEAMAEVLAKQGMYTKAEEMYQKLSLLNPGKIAYFASKIEQLKTRLL